MFPIIHVSSVIYLSSHNAMPSNNSNNHTVSAPLEFNQRFFSNLAASGLRSPQSSRYGAGLLDVKPGFELQVRHQNKMRKVFLWRFPLNRFLAKTLRVNKNCYEKLLKNLSFGIDFNPPFDGHENFRRPYRGTLAVSPLFGKKQFMTCIHVMSPQKPLL